MQLHFYATAKDLLPIFELVEAKIPLGYTRTGLFDEDAYMTFGSGAELPTLTKALGVSSAVAGPGYLVTERPSLIHSRGIQQNDGRKKFAIDQLMNPDSIVFQHGGLYSDQILLSGRIATASDTPVATKLQRAFSTALTKKFVRVKAYWVGPDALALLERGARLTIGAASPSEFDLALDS
jgi:hypothetical protein